MPDRKVTRTDKGDETKQIVDEYTLGMNRKRTRKSSWGKKKHQVVPSTDATEDGRLLGYALLKAISAAVQDGINAALGQNAETRDSACEKPYLTVAQAAQVSGLGQSTIRQAIRRRQLRAHKVGGRVVIRAADLQEFVESHPTPVRNDWRA